MHLVSLYLMACLYVGTGIMHFVKPRMYEKIMPAWLPWHKELVLISGVFEILFGLLLLFPGTRIIGAWCLIALLIAVFPANIQMAINYYKAGNSNLWIALLRLPLQFLLIWWAYSFTR